MSVSVSTAPVSVSKQAGLRRRTLAQTSLGIVCPMANEAGNAVRFVQEVLAQCNDLGQVRFYAVLDRVSKDGTRELLEQYAEREEPRLEVVWAPENRCVVDAYVRGYRTALDAGHDYVLEIDAGFSHQPSDIAHFLPRIEDGYDCIFGSRFMPGGRIERSSFTRRIVSAGGTMLTNLLTGTKLRDMTSGFQLFSRQSLESILAKGIQSKAHFFQTEMKYHCRNMKIVEVPITYAAASPSLSRKSLEDAFKNLWRLARLRFE